MMLASILGLVPSLRHKFAYSAWAAVTVAVVADDRVEASIVTAFYRVQGTIAGSLFGYLTVVIFGVGVIDVIDASCLPLACLLLASCLPLACLLLDRRWFGRIAHCQFHLQGYSEVTTLCFAVWGAMCGYVRTIPKFTYAANVAAFSTGIIVFSVRTEPSGDAAVPVLARIQQARFRLLESLGSPAA
jgi:hypothetical protein